MIVGFHQGAFGCFFTNKITAFDQGSFNPLLESNGNCPVVNIGIIYVWEAQWQSTGHVANVNGYLFNAHMFWLSLYEGKGF